MTTYLKDSKFNQSNFYQIRKTMYQDDRIMNDKQGGHNAVLLYGAIENKIGLSKSKHVNDDETKFINDDGQYYCVFPVKTAFDELRIKKGKYNQHKALLRDARLIDFEEQEEKKEGFASKITYTPWDIWVKQNGLYSDGKWIISPTIEDFYNPTDIVTVQPTIKDANDNDTTEETVTVIAEDEIAEFNELMDKVKYIGMQFHKAERMPDLQEVINSYYGRNKKITQAQPHELSKVRDVYAQLERTFKYGMLPDFF
ncbi:hypothetical protein [Bacillus mobilis]